MSKKVAVEMIFEKMTKNTVRFTEKTESEFAAPKVGTIYIPKSTLGEVGYKEGMTIVIEISVK